MSSEIDNVDNDKKGEENFFKVEGFLFNENPLIYVARISGNWLLEHVTPMWREPASDYR